MTWLHAEHAPAAVLVSLGALAGWTAVSSYGRSADPDDMIALTMTVALVFVLVRTLPQRIAMLVPWVIGSSILAALWATDAAFSGGPLVGPLGYANANAALFVQGVAAFALAGGRARRRIWLVCLSWLGMVVLTVAAATSGSKAGAVLAIVVVLARLMTSTGRLARAVASGAVAITILVIAMTVVLGVTSDKDRLQRGGTGRVIDETLTRRRVDLWHEAIDQVSRNPWRGVGPDRFQQFSPTARLDRDARWAHSATLQIAAETGVFGALLFVATACLGFVSLWSGGRVTRPQALSSVGLAALLVHAAQDYVLHFAAVPLVACALVGVSSRADGQ